MNFKKAVTNVVTFVAPCVNQTSHLSCRKRRQERRSQNSVFYLMLIYFIYLIVNLSHFKWHNESLKQSCRFSGVTKY